jgi:choline dehydrogenase
VVIGSRTLAKAEAALAGLRARHPDTTARAATNTAAAKAAAAEVSHHAVAKWGSVPETILQTAQEEQSDLIILGSRVITGWKRLMIGRTLNAVTARCEREVVLCAGAVASPQILQQSGIGDAAALKELGIAPVHHLPGVGENLHDHLFVFVQPRLKKGVPTLNRLLRSRPRLAAEVLRYGLFRTGALSLTSCEVCGFLDSTERGARPDIEITFRPLSFDLLPDGGWRAHPYPGGTASVCATRPRSRGRVTLARAADGTRRTAIQPNYLDHDEDVMSLVRGLRILRRILATEPFASCVAAEERPGPEVESDEALIAYVRETAGTVYHPVGTARMGSDAMSVVDARLRVHGIAGLRVADASIMPAIPSGNTNAPTIMIGEKAADMIRRDHN